MKLSKIFIMVLLLTACIPAVMADPVAPYGNASGSYSNTTGTDNLVVNTNIPLTLEDVAYPPLLFYSLIVIGAVAIAGGIWFMSKPDQIASYAIMACGLIAFGSFAVCAFMAPLVAASGSTVHIVPNATAGGAGTVYVTEVNNYLFSPWVGYLMWGPAMGGLLLLLLGVLSMFRTNKEKSIEQSVNQDGEQNYKGVGKKYKNPE